MSLSPMLVIGVGGSGGKTIRAMKQALTRKFQQKGWEEGFPSAWQFLQIDTTYDGLEFPAPMLPRDEVCVVVPKGAKFLDVRGRIEAFANVRTEQNDLLAGWGVPATKVDLEKGAGQIRGIGRMAGIAQAGRIRDAIVNAESRMHSTSSLPQLRALAKQLGYDPATTVTETPKAFIIASVAGGSGAGMFVDVAEILKLTYPDAWATQGLMSLLYTAEVFSGLPAAAGVKQNSLAAINEIIAGTSRPATRRSLNLLKAQGVPVGQPTTHIGSNGTLLIGSKNAFGANLALDGDGLGMDEVFLTIGEALAGIYTDPALAQWLHHFAFVNIAQTASNVDLTGLAVDGAVLPFASIGFGRLTVGIDRVKDYVADALTKRQMDALLWPDTLPRLPEGETAEQLIERKVVDRQDRFIEECLLRERGSSNQVIEQFYPADYKQAMMSLLKQVVNPLDNASKPMTSQRLAEETWEQWDSFRMETFNKMADGARANAAAWVQSVQDLILSKTAELAATEGIAVAAKVLAKVAEELDYVGRTDLRREADAHQKLSKSLDRVQWREKILEACEGKQGVTRDDKQVRDKIGGAINPYVEAEIHWQVKNLACKLLLDLRENFIEPLAQHLESNRSSILQDVRAEVMRDGRKNRLRHAPEWGQAVPKMYQPRSIERTLIKPEDFGQFYEDTAQIDLGRAGAFGVSVKNALLGEPLASHIVEKRPERFLEIDQHWWPNEHLGGAAQNAQKASFDVRIDPDQLSEANQKWLSDPTSAFGKVLNTSLRDFCDAGGDAVIAKQRQETFGKAYAELLNISSPLTKLNSAALTKGVKAKANGNAPDETQRRTSRVPFAPTGIAGSACNQALTSLGVDLSHPGAQSNWFDPSSRATDLLALQTSLGALPAFAFGSLTSPIEQQAAISRTDAPLWASFWNDRRTRPLPEAIPLAPGVLQSVITGWFIAKMFNLIEEQELPLGRGVRIWNSTLTDPNWSGFPSPLLVGSVEDNRQGWLLPSVLQSLGLAMVEFGTSGRMEALHGYSHLKFLGREVTSHFRLDEWLNNGLGDALPNGKQTARCDFLRRWISSADTSDLRRDVPTDPDRVGDAHGTPQIRANAIHAFVSDVAAQYADHWQRYDSVTWPDLPDMWEIREEIEMALRIIGDYVLVCASDGESHSDGVSATASAQKTSM